MDFPKKEFIFAFIYNKITNYFSFEKLNDYLSKLQEETKCKITCHYIEINEMDTKLNSIEKLDMVTCEPKEVTY